MSGEGYGTGYGRERRGGVVKRGMGYRGKCEGGNRAEEMREEREEHGRGRKILRVGAVNKYEGERDIRSNGSGTVWRKGGRKEEAGRTERAG